MNKLIDGAGFSPRASKEQRLREEKQNPGYREDWRKAADGLEKKDSEGKLLSKLLREASK